MKNILKNTTAVLLLTLFCLFAKSSTAQTTLVPGDLAIIGINNKGTTANLAVVALRNIEASTVIKFTDKGWLGATKALSLSAADGTITLTTGTITAGTAFTFTILGGPTPSVTVSPNVGSISMDGGWSAPNIAGNAGDSWLIYTGTEAAPDFIYGLANWATVNPLGAAPDQYGWVSSGTTSNSTVSYLPDALKTGDFHNNLAGANFLIYNSYSNLSSFTGTKASILTAIKNRTNWTQSGSTFLDLNPGTGNAFPATQPTFKIGSVPVAVTSNPSTGTRTIGASIAITVNFSDNVTVTGSPRIKLNSGVNAYANYTSGTSSKDLIFSYTVAAGESSADLDYSSSATLELNGGSLKDPQNEDATLTLPAPGSGSSLGGSSSIVIDAIAPAVTSVTAVTANGSYRAGQSIDINVNFSEAATVTGTPTLSLNNSGIASYVSGAGTSSLTFRYLIAANQNTTDLDYATVSSLSLTSATIKDAAGNNATLTLPTPGAAGSLGANANLIIDNIAPTVASVSGMSSLYNLGTTVPITLNFSETINVTGTPQLALNVSPAGFASYASGSGTATLTFNYIVAADQSSDDLDYISTTSLSLNGGTLKDLAGNNLTLTLPAPGAPGSLGALSNILINGIQPTILSIVRKNGAASLTNATTVDFTVTFSEPVSGVGTSDFSLKAGFPSGSSINSSTPSGSTAYTINVTTGTGNGTVGIDLNSSGTGIISVASANAISGGYTAGETYTIDKTVPTLTAITIQSNSAAGTGLAKAGDIITLSFTTSETINTPVVSINGNTASVVNNTGNNWVATYTTKATDNNGLVPFSFTYSDLAGNAGTPRGTTTDFTNVFFDKTAPTLPFVSIVANNASYPAYAKAGALVTLSFRASESITTPIVTIGGATVTASPAGGFNWVALYVLPSGLAEGVVPFTINYTDTYGNPGAQQTTVSTGSMVTLDKTTPTLSNVSISSNNQNPALAKPGDQVTVTFTASEGLGTPTVSIDAMPATVLSLAGNVWTATLTLSPANTTGLIPFQILYSDFARNAGVPVITTNDASTVIYDKTLPAVPNFLGVTAGDTQNTMMWFLDADYAKYELIGGATGVLGNNVLTTVLAANATNPMTFTQTGLTNFQTYYYALRVTDAAGNINTSSTASGTPLNAQTITFDQPIAAEYGSSFTINATSISGLPVIFTSNEPALATISGNTVTIVGANSLQSVSIIATQPGNANYSYAQPVIRLLQILPKPVTVTAAAQTKVFGDVEPAIAAPTITPALTGTDVSTGTLSRVSGENAGNYEIQQNSFNLDQYKYAITYVPANFTVSKKPVTITPKLAYSKTYGATDPTFEYNFTPLVSTDVITGALARVAGEDAGTYNFDLGTLSAGTNYNLLLSLLPQFTINNSTITVTPITASIQYGDAEPVIGYNFTPTLKTGDAFTGALARAPGNTPNSYLINQGTLALSSNYTLNFSAAPVNFVVLKKNISITPGAGQGKIYGDSDGSINYTVSPALLNGDTFSGTLGRAAGSAVADYQISMGSLVASNPGNYNLQLSTENYAITRKPIMVTATAVNQVYGDTDPVSLPYTLSTPLATGDSFTGKLARTAGTAVGSYPVNQGNLALGSNYDLNFTAADLTITPKAIAITAVGKAKNYGENDPAFEYNFSPLVSPDVITGTLTRVPGENEGTYNFELGTLNAGTNYTLNLSPLPQFTINKASITVTPITASIQYGDAEPVIGYNFTPALNPGDTFTGALARAPGNTPNSYLINQGTLALSSNYTLNFSAAPVNFVVLKKNISITPGAGQGKIYGDSDGSINYTASPALLNGDTFSGALSRTAGSAVADYQISMGSLVASNPGNYNLQLSTENYAITRKPIMVTATAVNQVYGDTDPVSLPYTLSAPLATGDSFTGKLARTAGTAVGSYPVNQGNLALGSNYDLNFTTADLTITPKAIAITAVSNTKTYGDADPVFAYTGSSALIAGDSYTGMLGRVSGENTGNYALALGSLKLTDNYTLTLNPGATLTISKKGIQVTAEAKSKVYGSADPVLSYSPNPALVAGDSFSGLLSRIPGENKGTYPTTPGSLTAGPNYSLTFTAANLNIAPAPLTVTADAKSKFAGTANPVFTGQYAGFVNGEDASVLISPAVYTSVATVASPIGTYPIVPSGATALNYLITPVNGVLTVSAGAPTSVLFAGITLYENQVAGTKAGTLSSTSDDPQATFTYRLVTGTGDADNPAFRISGDQLLTAASLDYENKKTYSVLIRSTTQHGFSLDKSFTINLSDVNEIPTLDAITNLAICYTTGSQTIDLTGISSGPETGQNARITVTGSNAALLQSLTVSSASGFASGKETISYRVKNGASGISTITVTVKDNGGTDNGGVDTYSRSFVLTVNALPIVAISASKGDNNNANSTSVSKGETVVLTASGGSTYIWAVSNSAISGQNAASLTVRPRETTTYTVTVSNANGCTEQKSFTVNVQDDLMTVKATNILSPNGDGYNDKWIIDNIDFYPNNEVKIFDKSGRSVYSKKSYDNTWDGMLNGMPLSEGTYFYVIDFGKDRLKFKGFITIVREN